MVAALMLCQWRHLYHHSNAHDEFAATCSKHSQCGEGEDTVLNAEAALRIGRLELQSAARVQPRFGI